MQPGKDTHPRLHELWNASSSALTVWRLRYNMPPNDPRVLSITDEEVFDDLATLAYFDLRAEIASTPSLSEQSNPERREAWSDAQARVDRGENEVLNSDLDRLARVLGVKREKPNDAPPEAPPMPPAKPAAKSWLPTIFTDPFRSKKDA